MESNDTTGNERIPPPQAPTRPRHADTAVAVDLWTELDQVRRRVDDLFGRFFGSAAISPVALVNPRAVVSGAGEIEPDMDVYENDAEFIVHAALPGVDPNDIRVEATEKSIRLTAERSTFSSEAPEHAANPAARRLQSRFSHVSRFSTSYALPSEIDPYGSRAEIRNGQLELHLPKRDARTSRTVEIPIQGKDAPRAGQPPVGASIGQGATEGNPGAKIGAAYNPTAGEDHTAKVQSIGEREDHGVALKGPGK